MQFFDLKSNALSSIDRDRPGWKVAGESFELGGNLHSEFSSWGEYHSLDSSCVWFNPLEHGESVGNCLSGSCVSLADDISPFEQRLDGLGLNREGVDVTHVSEPVEKARLQTQGFELLRQLLFITGAAETHKDLPATEASAPRRICWADKLIQEEATSRLNRIGSGILESRDSAKCPNCGKSNTLLFKLTAEDIQRVYSPEEVGIYWRSAAIVAKNFDRRPV